MRASSARRHTMNTSIRWIVCFVALRNAQRNARMIWLWALYGLFYGSSIALHIATGGAHLSLSALYLYLCLSLFFLFFLPLSVTHQFDVSLYFFSFLSLFSESFNLYISFQVFLSPSLSLSFKNLLFQTVVCKIRKTLPAASWNRSRICNGNVSIIFSTCCHPWLDIVSCRRYGIR